VREGIDEGDLVHQVRCEPLQVEPALLERLGDETEVEHLEVAQPSVHELAGPARRARGEVACLDQADRQAAGRGVEGRATTHDATTDDQDVEGRGRHRVERGETVLG
jgi:hypothetical protein